MHRCILTQRSTYIHIASGTPTYICEKRRAHKRGAPVDALLC